MGSWVKGPKQAGRSTMWQTVVWFCDSFQPSDLADFCSTLDFPSAFAVHDRDTYDRSDLLKARKDGRDFDDSLVGQPKKLHAHLLLSFSSLKAHTQVSEQLELLHDRVNGWVEKTIDTTGAQAYLLHLNNPDKSQYTASDLHLFGGFDFSPQRKMNAEERQALVPELVRFIREEGISSYAVLCEYVCCNRPDLIQVAMKDYAYSLKCICESIAAQKAASVAADKDM